MCRMLVAEGVRHATALAHQNDDYPENRADQLRSAAAELSPRELASRQIPLSVYPTGEVMLSPTIVEDWHAGQLLSVGNRAQWLLVEMPHGMFVDVLPFAERLRAAGVRIIIAHAERYPELLDDPALAAQLDRGGMPDPGDGPGPRGAVGHGSWSGGSNSGWKAASSISWARMGTASTGGGRCWPPGSSNSFDGAGVPPPSELPATGGSPCFRGWRSTFPLPSRPRGAGSLACSENEVARPQAAGRQGSPMTNPPHRVAVRLRRTTTSRSCRASSPWR